MAATTGNRIKAPCEPEELRHCLCDCSREVKVPYIDLRNGAVKHCGCGVTPRFDQRKPKPAVARVRRSRLTRTEIAQAFLMRCVQGKTYPKIADALEGLSSDDSEAFAGADTRQ